MALESWQFQLAFYKLSLRGKICYVPARAQVDVLGRKHFIFLCSLGAYVWHKKNLQIEGLCSLEYISQKYAC